MSWLNNPVIEEGLQVYLTNKRVRRIYSYYFIFLALVLLIVWPKQPFQYFLKFNRYPQSFHITSICILISLCFLNIQFGSDSYTRDLFHSISDWLTLTPLTVLRLLLGKLTLSLIHCIFLLIFSLPFFIIPMSLSGVFLKELLMSILIILFCSMTCRIMGLLCLVSFRNHPFIHGTSLLLFLVILLFPTISLFPSVNPILALLRVKAENLMAVASLHSALSLFLP